MVVEDRPDPGRYVEGVEILGCRLGTVMNRMIDRDRQEDNRGMEIVMAACSGLH